MADVFFKAGYIEAWGRGTIKIIEACRKAGLSDPEFSKLTGGFLVAFTKAPADGVEKGGQKSKVKSKVKVIEMIVQNPSVTIPEIAASLDMSIPGIEKIIRSLKKQKRLRRIGPDKGGHWEVLK